MRDPAFFLRAWFDFVTTQSSLCNVIKSLCNVTESGFFMKKKTCEILIPYHLYLYILKEWLTWTWLPWTYLLFEGWKVPFFFLKKPLFMVFFLYFTQKVYGAPTSQLSWSMILTILPPYTKYSLLLLSIKDK